jgi:hypothetical protein
VNSICSRYLSTNRVPGLTLSCKGKNVSDKFCSSSPSNGDLMISLLLCVEKARVSGCNTDPFEFLVSSKDSDGWL